MAAPDFGTLMDIETEVESVFVSILNESFQSNGFSVIASGSDPSVERVTPLCTVVACRQSEGRHQTVVPVGQYAGRAVYDRFDVAVVIAVDYSPDWMNGQGGRQIRGVIREAVAQFEAIKAQFAVNDYYRLAPDTLRQIGGRREYDQNKVASQTHEYIMTLFISPNGWPT